MSATIALFAFCTFAIFDHIGRVTMGTTTWLQYQQNIDQVEGHSILPLSTGLEHDQRESHMLKITSEPSPLFLRHG